MKKHLLAVAVAATLPSIAMAQVTVYGNIEMGPSQVDAGATTTTVISNGVVNSSRLGFRGEEDLGGGLKAFFRLESGLNPETGTIGGSRSESHAAAGTTASVSNSNFFNRGAEIGLSGAFGTFKLGKFDLPSEAADISHFGNVGLAATSGIYENDIEIGSDVNGAISYKTPAFNGITFEIAGTYKDQTDGTSSAATPGELVSMGLSGSIGALSFNIATVEQSGTSTGNVQQNAVSVSYDFGVAKASLTRIDNDGGSAADRNLTIVSAVAPLGNGLAVHGMYRTFNVDGQANDQKGYALGVSKALSKRTTGYAAYLGANGTTGSSGTTISTTAKPSTYYIGVNHAF